MALLEEECEEGTALGKLRRVDRPEDDSGLLPGHDGVTVTDPVQVRRLLRTHFHEWFVPKPGHCGGIEGDESSWRQMVDPLADFQLVKQSYGQHHIPGGQVDNRLLEVALDPSDGHEFEPDAE